MEVMSKETFINFLDSLSESIENENIELYKRIVQNSKIKEINDYEQLYHFIIYPFNKFMKGFVKTEIAENNDVAFLYSNSKFIENHFRNMIIKYEGSACCADKSRTIMKCLINYFLTDSEINFDYKAEYTYHLPKIIFTNHVDIIEFYEALRALWYGNPLKYLQVLTSLG